MQKPIYFQFEKFISSVIEGMKLGDINAPTLLQLREMIEDRLAERVFLTVIDHFGVKEVERFDKLLNDHPEISEIDALILMAPEIDGLKEDLEKNIGSLYKELTYDAEQIEVAIKSSVNK